MSGILLAAFPAGAIYSLANLPSALLDVGGTTATYGVRVAFRTDGTIDIIRNQGSDDDDVETYVIPASRSAGLHVRCTYVSGDHLTGATEPEDTWLALTSERIFLMQYASGGGSDDVSGVFDFELSNDGGTTVVASAEDVTINVGELF